MKFERIFMIVLDSVGIGELPDAAKFGDVGAHTLGHIAAHVPHFNIPHLQQLGIANIQSLPGIKPVEEPLSYYGKMAEVSAGKDTMTGHWELMGLHISTPFQVFPQGFPLELIQNFERATGRSVIGNVPASGTEIIERLGEQQMNTGAWIVYTSADSVMQIAAHEGVIPLEELYHACEIARKLTSQAPYAVGRVIARPYLGSPGNFKRTANRHDYAVKPPGKTVMNHLQAAGLEVWAIGKINDIYCGEGVSKSSHTASNQEGIAQILEATKHSFQGLCFANLVDFDSLYGHRRDPLGYGQALMDFDGVLPQIQAALTDRDLLIITADHGNDPTFPGTDHTREYVPLLVYSPSFKHARSLGVRTTFADVGATIADHFAVTAPSIGQSFLSLLR